jgi:GTP-binding protein Era
LKSGFVSIVGKPNVGKSSLLNALLGSHVSITSEKPETTRKEIIGIKTTDDFQMVFIDTPGFDNFKHMLNQKSNQIAVDSATDCDVLVFLVDRTYNSVDKHLFENLNKTIPTILVVNKCDIYNEVVTTNIINSYKKVFEFSEVVIVSALKNINIDILTNKITNYFFDEIMYYPDKEKTTMNQSEQISESIREQIMRGLEEEVPHSCAVLVENIKKLDTNKYKVFANIIIDRESLKPIVIGKGGTKIKSIRLKAEKEIKRNMGIDVSLELFVKVVKDWRNKASILTKLGL